MPKPLTSGAKAKGRFGKQDFVYLAADDVYRCPAGERLVYRFTSQERGLSMRRYWTNACQGCAIKHRCTTACIAPGSLDTSLSHAAGLSDIAVCHAWRA